MNFQRIRLYEFPNTIKYWSHIFHQSFVVMDPRFKHPFTCLVAGPTGSGKTVFVTQFIKHIHEMTVPTPTEIYWHYGQWQASYQTMSNINFREGVPKMSDYEGYSDRLIIIDDLMDETNASVTELFTKGSHHRNISVMYLVQNLFSKNKEHRTISLNSQYLILFKNPRDASQISSLAKQMYPSHPKYLQAAYIDAISRPYGYLLLDLKQSTSDKVRVRTSIFPEDQQIVYLPE